MLAPSLKNLMERAFRTAAAEDRLFIGPTHFAGAMLLDDDGIEFLRHSGADISNLQRLLADATNAENEEKFASSQDSLKSLCDSKDPVTLLADESSGLSPVIRMGLIGDDVRTVSMFRSYIQKSVQLVKEVVEFQKGSPAGLDESVKTCFHKRLQQTFLRAAFAMAMADKESLNEHHVMAAMFEDRSSAAVKALEKSGVSRLDMLFYISHKISKLDERPSRQAHSLLRVFLDFFNCYRVLMHNDDYTSKEFVVYVLTTVFTKTDNEAYTIMEKIHREGVAVVGLYPLDIAQTRVELAMTSAREKEFPFLCTVDSEPWGEMRVRS